MSKKQLNWKPLGTRWQAYTPRRTARGLPVVNANGDNCGTGAGGFKRGNTCASGGSGKPPIAGMVRRQDDTITGLAREIGIRGGDLHDVYEQYLEGYEEGNIGIENYAKELVASANKVGFRYATGNPDNPRADRSWATTLEHPEGHLFSVRFEPGGEFHRDNVIYHLEFVPRENREGYAISREAGKASSYAGYSVFTVMDYARTGKHEDAVDAHLRTADMHARYAVTRDQPNAKALHRDAEAAHRIAADYHMEKAGL